jgi:hypothetical protein
VITLTIELRNWSQQLLPGLCELSNSDPSATLGEANLVVVTEDPPTAQDIARRLEHVDAQVTSITFGRARQDEALKTVDPEGVTAHAARRAGVGALIGAIVGAVIIGAGAGLLAGSGTAAAGAAIGGALFGAFAGAVWNFVIGTGQSDAYRESFVDQAESIVTVVAVSGSGTAVGAAAETLNGRADIRMVRANADGDVLGEK